MPHRRQQPDHLRGRWLHRADWTRFATAARRPLAALPRQAWLAPARIEEQQSGLTQQFKQWLDGIAEDANAQLLVRLIEGPQHCWLESRAGVSGE